MSRQRASSTVRPPLREGRFLWARRRKERGVSLRQLERESGIYRGFLSRMENGSMIPTADEFDRVMSALETLPRGGVATE